jgi:O-acetyl-ADP-ribose deacetylase (regulator of RNase III)
MGSGIAKQIRERFPKVYQTYMERYMNSCWNPSERLLGTIDVVYEMDQNVIVINMYSQYDYGYDGQRYTSYDAFSDALYAIKKEVHEGYTIAFPKYIGCGFGGANWKIISTMIEEILGKDYDVYIYEYNPKED